MRSTAIIPLLPAAAMAAPEHTASNWDGSIIVAPPVTVTVTSTEYNVITSWEVAPPVTETITSWEAIPPVTVTVTTTDFIDNLYDQSYGGGYELGDVITAPTIITETKTFTLAAGHGKAKPTTTEVVGKWSIATTTPYKATVTEFVSTATVKEHVTSTVWVDEVKSTKSAGAPTENHSAATSAPAHDVPTDEELENQLAIIWQSEQAAAESAAHAAASKLFDTATKSAKVSASPSSTSNSASPHKVYGSTHIHSTTTSHSSGPSTSSTPSTTYNLPIFTGTPKPSWQTSAKPASSVAAGKYEGKISNTPDGTCGKKAGGIAYSCAGNSRGSCCSEYGHCGSEEVHCGAGCQSAFGTCGSAAVSRKASLKAGYGVASLPVEKKPAPTWR